jgi:hypothetical protein
LSSAGATTDPLYRSTLLQLARRLCLRATPIFALCSDHCKKNNGNHEANAFVNPFWVERDLNPYIKPYRQYYSAFLTLETSSTIPPILEASRHLPGDLRSLSPPGSQASATTVSLLDSPQSSDNVSSASASSSDISQGDQADIEVVSHSSTPVTTDGATITSDT